MPWGHLARAEHSEQQEWQSAEGSARVGIGARATAAGLAQEFIYKRSLQSKFLSILTLLPPVVPRSPPTLPQLAFSLMFCLFGAL